MQERNIYSGKVTLVVMVFQIKLSQHKSGNKLFDLLGQELSADQRK